MRARGKKTMPRMQGSQPYLSKRICLLNVLLGILIFVGPAIYSQQASGIAAEQRSRLNEQLNPELGVVSVKDFGAVGDGKQDETAHIQNAMDAARIAHLPCFFPPGKYLVHKVAWNGCDLMGAGNKESVIAGFPGEDVFYVADPSTHEQHALYSWPSDVRVTNLCVVVDCSMRCDNFRDRVAWSLSGTWSANRAVKRGEYYATSRGVIYLAVRAGVTGEAEPDPAVDYIADGTLQWYRVADRQYQYGNAAFAFPLRDGKAQDNMKVGVILRPRFENVLVEGTGAGGNAVGFFFQRPPYGALFQKTAIRYVPNGWIGCAPAVNAIEYTWSTDTCQWNGCDTYCNSPFRWFDGSACIINNLSVYATAEGQRGIELWPLNCVGEDYPHHWLITDYYCEPNRLTNGRLSVFAGDNIVLDDCILKGAFGPATIDFLCSNSVAVNCSIQSDPKSTCINLFGDQISVSRLHTTSIYGCSLPGSIVNDKGLGNSVSISQVDSTAFESERAVIAEAGTVRAPMGMRTNDWLMKGCQEAPFYDPLIGMREILDFTGTFSPVGDLSLETGGYQRRTEYKRFESGYANRQLLSIGGRIPGSPIRFFVKGRASENIRCGVALKVGSTVVFHESPLWTIKWEVLGFDVDLSSFVGKNLTIVVENPERDIAYQDIAWFAFVPYSLDNRIIKNTWPGGVVDLEGNGSPEGKVDAPPGSTYRNNAGGKGATFWIKEGGSGANGWVAK